MIAAPLCVTLYGPGGAVVSYVDGHGPAPASCAERAVNLGKLVALLVVELEGLYGVSLYEEAAAFTLMRGLARESAAEQAARAP